MLHACPFHALTGLACPGCGGTRAAFAMLAGDWSAAFRFNPLLTLLVPAACVWFVTSCHARRWLWHPAATRALLAAALAFGVLRNF